TAAESKHDGEVLSTCYFNVSAPTVIYTVTVRDDVKWGDGEPFGADDVLFTYHVLQDIEYQQPGASDWRQVGIAAGGPNQVVFTLKAPDASFPLSLDRKSTRLNSSHDQISYAVFCLKKKKFNL